MGLVVPEIYLAPEVLRLGRCKPGARLQRKVQVISADNRPLQINKVNIGGDMDVGHEKIPSEKVTKATLELDITVLPKITSRNVYRGTVEYLVDIGGETRRLTLRLIAYR